jgi:AcrR family transcriptional regulator
MPSHDEAASRRRPGSETREEILRVALDMFTRQGFEATSIRDIADALGMTKSALYYHFRSKDELATSLFAKRRHELDELVEWIRAQPPSKDLVRRAALRWIDRATPEQLQGMRFARANQPAMKRLAARGDDIRLGFDTVVNALLPEAASAQDRIFTRMAFDTLGAALFAAEGTAVGYEDVLAAARRATIALTAS